MRRLCWISLPLALAALFVACADTTLPGNPVGTFNVTGTLETNSCGAGLAPPSPWTFSVELSMASGTLYWSTMDGSPLLSGPITSALVATMTANNSANVDGTADGGEGPCDLARVDTYDITLAQGVPTPSFNGSIEYDFSVVPGATCTDQLTAAGGMYDTIPCTMTYSVSATRQ